MKREEGSPVLFVVAVAGAVYGASAVPLAGRGARMMRWRLARRPELGTKPRDGAIATLVASGFLALFVAAAVWTITGRPVDEPPGRLSGLLVVLPCATGSAGSSCRTRTGSHRRSCATRTRCVTSAGGSVR